MKTGNLKQWVIACLLVPCNFAFGQKSAFRIVDLPEQKRVDVMIDGKLFTSLLYADSLKKHVLYPVKALGDIEVTRGWPVSPNRGDQIDHPHQIGVWFNYGDINGADYWNNSTKIDTNKKAYGTIKVRAVENIKTGSGKGELRVLSTWINPGGRAVLEESTRYVFRQVGAERIIYRETELKALQDVLFKDNKEGLFAIRVSRQLEAKSDKAVDVYVDRGLVRKVVDKEITKGVYESSRGVKGEEVFGTRSEWLKLSGSIDSKPVSVVLMDHPKNVNYPGFWMARGYGLFAINPLGAEFYTNGKEQLNFRLAKGESVVFKHQLLISGLIERNGIEKVYRAFKEE